MCLESMSTGRGPFVPCPGFRRYYSLEAVPPIQHPPARGERTTRGDYPANPGTPDSTSAEATAQKLQT